MRTISARWLVGVLALGMLAMDQSKLLAADRPASAPPTAPSLAATSAAPTADALGVTFVEGSTTTVVVARGGKRYLVDLVSRQVRDVDAPAPAPAPNDMASSAAPSQAAPPVQQPPEQKPGVYEPGDDFLFSLPTGRRLDQHGFYVNFNHRFAFNTAFTGKARGHVLMGLDDFSLSSFGFRYGLTRKASVEIYRSPSLLGRPIQLSAGYNFFDEHDGKPMNAAIRFSVEGQNDFSRNFTFDFEGMFSRSLTSRAQVYVVPTVSLRDHPLIPPVSKLEDPFPKQTCGASLAQGIAASLNVRPCANTFSLGVGAAVDIRPTVALVAEVIPTLVNGTELGIHRPAYSFGIQKKIWRHAFTFGFSNSPGTTVAQRAGTRATLLSDPTADKPSGLFVGFDLTRQIY